MATEKEIAFWEQVFVACVQGAVSTGRVDSLDECIDDSVIAARKAVEARRKEFPDKVADHRELDDRSRSIPPSRWNY